MKKGATYANGQKMFEQKGGVRTVFYKNGKLRAKGKHINGMMEGKWMFYREAGQLWVVGNFKHDKKHGDWIRYNKVCALEYHEKFVDGKIVKPAGRGPGGATSEFPKISAPANRALDNAKIKTLKQLAKYTEKEILSLHGIGPSAMPPLRKALKAKGLGFAK